METQKCNFVFFFFTCVGGEVEAVIGGWKLLDSVLGHHGGHGVKGKEVGWVRVGMIIGQIS